MLRLAVDQASLSGLDSLTIGTLAADAGVSKSNVATLFGSKLDLQLATIEAAREIFIDAVIAPALAGRTGSPGSWRSSSCGWTTPRAGCSPADASSALSPPTPRPRTTPARDLLVSIDEEWFVFLARAVRESMAELPGLDGRADGPEVLAFEITAMLDAANIGSLLHRSTRGYALARSGIRDRLLALGAPASISL